MTREEEYINFLSLKMAVSSQTGFDVEKSELTPTLYPHVKDTVQWAIKGGCRAIFSSFGLQKTVTQLEIARLVIAHKGGKALIVCPKRVVIEFKAQAKEHLNMDVTYVRYMTDVIDCKTDIMIANYERVRDGDIKPDYFIMTSLDEASVLRDYGTKTYQEFLPKFSTVPYRFVATATPSPNRYKELIHYAGYLGIMDTGQALTRFFKRDSTKANNLTLYDHKEEEFWLWMSTWALFLTKPSDLGYSDEGYELPDLIAHEEVVNVDNSTAGVNKDGQVKMLREASTKDFRGKAKERRDNLDAKVDRIVEILARPENKDDHFLIWHDLEAERHAICKAIPECKAVYGTQKDEEADIIIDDFKNGRLKYLAAKPSMLGEGLNFQYHCHKAIMIIDDKFHDKFQAIHRIWRFMQKHNVHLYLVYAESESKIYQDFVLKWEQHNKLVDNMAEIVRKYGLYGLDAQEKMMRWMFASREEYKGTEFISVNNDCVLEAFKKKDNSSGLVITSIPFSNHYEYTPTYNDFGHNINNDKFFQQMDFLTPEMYRILQPGRLACIHVKDRVLFGNATGTGMPTIDPFHAMCIFHYIKHGFEFMGMITVVTDVVRENNQTYRLGYTEMCKDGSKMGVGCPEYVLLFRKPQTNKSKAYADIPVVKDPESYSLARWQVDAHAFWKSSGNTLLTAEHISNMKIDQVRLLFKDFDRNNVYNYERHVEIAEMMDRINILPRTFMAIDPTTDHPMVWDDVARMKTLNTRQTQHNKQNHICPLQIDIVDRLIDRYSNEGDEIYEPFGGIGTVGYCALKKKRKAFVTELNYDYWTDGLGYMREAEMKASAPTLFDLMEIETV